MEKVIKKTKPWNIFSFCDGSDVAVLSILFDIPETYQ